MITLPFTGVGDPLKEQELKAHAERANIFLENYAKMQRDIEDGSFVLKKPTRWQMPDGYSSRAVTISGKSGIDIHRQLNETGVSCSSRTRYDPRHVQFIRAGNAVQKYGMTVITY
eukprot:gene9843-11658_t